MRLALLMLTASLAWGAQGFVLTSGAQRTATLAPGQVLRRVEIRYLSVVGAGWTEFGTLPFRLTPTGGGGCEYYAATRYFDSKPQIEWRGGCQTNIGGGGTRRVDLTPFITGGQVDLLIRGQWDDATNRLTLLVCRGDGTGCAFNFENMLPGVLNTNGPFEIANYTSGTGGTLAFVRAYSTIEPQDTKPPLLYDPVGGDILNVVLDGTFTDSSPNAYALSGSGGSYTGPLPVYAPSCSAGAIPAPGAQVNWNALGFAPTLRAGVASTLTGTATQNTGDPGSPTVYWQQLAGPSRLVWSGQNTLTPTIQGAISTYNAASSYRLALTVTDNLGQSTTCEALYGAVATDPQDRVILPDPRLQEIYGAMTRFGTPSTYPYMDQRLSDWLQALVIGEWGTTFARPWNEPLPGSVSRSADGIIVTGTGTDFQNDFCGGGTVPNRAFVVWIPQPAGVPIRKQGLSIASCDSPTQITIANDGSRRKFEGAGVVSGLTYSRWNPNGQEVIWFNFSNGTRALNYYDYVVSLFGFAMRSGMPEVREWAQRVADEYWQQPQLTRVYAWSIDFANYSLVPERYYMLLGMIVRAIDHDITVGVPGDSYVWEGLAAMSDYYTTRRNVLGYGSPIVSGDLREDGFRLMHYGLLGKYLPDTYSTQRNDSRVSSAAFVDIWEARKRTSGDRVWFLNVQNLGSPWNDGPMGLVAVTNGSTAVTQSTASTNFISRGVNNLPIRIFPQTGGTCSSLEDSYLDVPYRVASVASETQLTLDVPWAGPTATNMCWQFGANGGSVGWGFQSFMLSVVGNGLHYADLALTAAGDTARAAQARAMHRGVAMWLADSGWTGASDKGIIARAYWATCQPPFNLSMAPECIGSVFDRRVNGADAVGVLLQAYAIDPAANLLTVMDSLVDGGWNTSDPDRFTTLNSSPAGTDWNSRKASILNLATGLGLQQSWQAIRQGPQPGPDERTVRLVIGSPAAATSTTVRLIWPSGQSQDIACTAGVCAGQIDWRQGSQVVWQARHFAGSDLIVAGRLMPLTVQ